MIANIERAEAAQYSTPLLLNGDFDGAIEEYCLEKEGTRRLYDDLKSVTKDLICDSFHMLCNELQPQHFERRTEPEMDLKQTDQFHAIRQKCFDGLRNDDESFSEQDMDLMAESAYHGFVDELTARGTI